MGGGEEVKRREKGEERKRGESRGEKGREKGVEDGSRGETEKSLKVQIEKFCGSGV